ncbi:SOS response-associated peptidase family protein [Pseudomonas syringae]|uniref:SOS response-associated peptidase family protein n=1 Tax=Pseudomonas syringae TaxID=317 RepID=UPI001F135240|nr:SOS response-associated peptidase family protein [Pseudomonas syringae]
MCSHYEAPSPQQVAEAFGVALFDQGRLDLWPGYIGPFLRRPDGLADDNDSPATMEVLTGSFGLIPSWSKDSKFAKRIYNARSETVAEKPSYRHAWRQPSVILNTALLSQQRWPLGWVIPTGRKDAWQCGLPSVGLLGAECGRQAAAPAGEPTTGHEADRPRQTQLNPRKTLQQALRKQYPRKAVR